MVTHLVKKFCNNVDGIIAPSSIVEEQLQQSQIKTKTARIPSGVAEHFFSAMPRLPKQPSTKIQLLSVSRFAKEKNITFLLDVVAALNPTQFNTTFIGYGPEKNNLERYAFHHKKISPQAVQFIERPSKEILLHAYYAADIFIFASKSETQGIVLAEAMSQGTPVVAVHGPGQRDLIEQGKNGFLVHTQQDMQTVLEYIHANPTLLASLQHNAFATAQNFKPEIVTQKLIDFYYDVINHYSTSPKRNFELIY